MQRTMQWIQQNRILLIGIAGLTLVTVGVCVVALPALAAPSDYFDVGGIFKDTGLSDDTPMELTLKIIKTVLEAVGAIALVLLIYAGFTIMTASGHAERVQTGRTILMWTIIGIIIIFSSLGIIAFIERSLF